MNQIVPASADPFLPAVPPVKPLGSLKDPAIDVGNPISRPGVYAMSMARYHSDCCAGPSGSNSNLKTVWDESPAHYWAKSYLNPLNFETRLVEGQEVTIFKPNEGDERPQFSTGRAAHHLLFQGRKGFDAEFAVRPEKWSDWRTQAAKDWKRDARRDGLTVITQDELEVIVGMARSLAAEPLIKGGLLDGYVERSLIWQDPATGVWLKSRPDCIPNDSGDFADLKTTVSVQTRKLQWSMADYNYPMQGGLTAIASEAVLQRPLSTFTLVFVEKTPPYCVRIVTIKPDDLDRGRRQVEAAVKLFAECWALGQWPGPGGYRQDAEYLDLPDNHRKAVEERLALFDLEHP